MDIVKSKRNILLYVIFTFVLFGLLLATLGAIATYIFHGAPLAMRWLTAITAWTPTIVLLMLFKKLYPDSTIKAFYKKAFRQKLNVKLLVTITLLQILIFASSVFMASILGKVPTFSLIDASLAIVLPALFFTLIQGATGEESGWRGYLLPAITEKVGVVKGSLIVSLIWAFWHAPIWFLGTGYHGAELVKYIIVFVICITSLGFVIGICYFRCHNLFVPILIHFTFNFLGELFSGDLIDLVMWYAVFYLMLAFGFYFWHKSNRVDLSKENNQEESSDSLIEKQIQEAK